MTEAQNLEPVLAALIARICTQPLVKTPNAEMIRLADSLSSAPLSAFARALGSHPWPTDFGRFETTAENLEENGFYEDIVESLEPLGQADAEGICIGTTGGGEEALLMVADDSQPGGYVIYRYAYDGQPYSNGQPIETIGQLEHLLRELDGEGQLNEVLRAVLVDSGVPEPEVVPPEEPKPPSDGIVLRRVEEPVALSVEEKRQRFAKAYDDDRILDAIQIAFRTAEGRIAGHINGYPAGKHMVEMVVADANGDVALQVTDAWPTKSSWLAGHPTDERALMAANSELVEVDLCTGERTTLAPQPGIAGYLLLGGRERILTLSADQMIRIWAHTPGEPLGATPLAEFEVGSGKWYDSVLYGFNAFLRPVSDERGLTYLMVEFVENTPGTIELDTKGQLHVMDKTVDASRRWLGRTLDGVTCLLVHTGWFAV